MKNRFVARVFHVFFLVAGWSCLCLSQKPDARGSFALCDLHEFGEKCWSPFGMSHITLIGPLALAVSRSAGAARPQVTNLNVAMSGS